MNPGKKLSGNQLKGAAAPAAPTSPPPAPPSPRETWRRRLRKLLAGLGIFTAGSLSAYLFQPGENAANVEPTPTARLDPSQDIAPYDDVSQKHLTEPTAIAARSSFAEREKKDKENSLAKGVYPLDVKVGDFLKKVAYVTKDAKGELRGYRVDSLHSDLAQNEREPADNLPNGVKSLFAQGALQSGFSGIRVRLVADESDPILSGIFSGLEFPYASIDDRADKKAQRIVDALATMMDVLRDGLAADFSPDRATVESSQPPEATIARAINHSLEAVRNSLTAPPKSLQDVVSTAWIAPPKEFLELQTALRKLTPEIDLGNIGDDYEERLDAIRRDPDSSKMLSDAMVALRKCAVAAVEMHQNGVTVPVQR